MHSFSAWRSHGLVRSELSETFSFILPKKPVFNSNGKFKSLKTSGLSGTFSSSTTPLNKPIDSLSGFTFICKIRITNRNDLSKNSLYFKLNYTSIVSLSIPYTLSEVVCGLRSMVSSLKEQLYYFHFDLFKTKIHLECLSFVVE
ncbi:hypothetical protein BpHYR1_006358 [Brachionus plicatilis]|uniref:Uncharacterized protein n=1 Tax=Brachionus plicatilis TaxID=10195 RepID=A0A3M7SA53_BRAPC|nr:hypothetical protein BpHYR1_006358 [Brachionus plicatilis]